VFEAAASGDRVAREVIAWAGRELGDLANGVIRQLKLEDEAFEVVLVGSMYNSGDILINPMREVIHAVAPRAKLVRLEAPPVVGGALLGMAQAGLDGSPVRSRLIHTTNSLLTRRQVQP
jgi:N-acetylglucosamine kinase-like BadF-type ATPase